MLPIPLLGIRASELEKVTKSFVFAPWFASVTVITDEPSVAVKNISPADVVERMGVISLNAPPSSM